MPPLKRLFGDGFRVFFLSAGLFAFLAMAVWEGYLLIQALGGVLGLLQGDPQAFLQAGSPLDETQIAVQIAVRAAAKAAKNWAEADRIRQELLAQGIALKDGPGGTTWEAV